jgi:hypothetical protein
LSGPAEAPNTALQHLVPDYKDTIHEENREWSVRHQVLG